MPIYEYLCNACGHQLEEFQKFSDAPLKICPNCNQPELQKQMSATSFQLKGTGWYVTDTRDKGKPKPAATESGTEDKGSTAETKSSDVASSDKSVAAPSTPSDKSTKE